MADWEAWVIAGAALLIGAPAAVWLGIATGRKTAAPIPAWRRRFGCSAPS